MAGLALFYFGAKRMGWLDKKDKAADPAVDPAKNPTQDAAQADEMLAKLRTTFEEVLKPVREKVDSYETRFTAIEESTRKPAPRTEPNEIPSVLDGPDAENEAFNRRLSPIITTVSQISGQMVEDRVVNDITAQGWGELVPDLRKALATVAPGYKADPSYETSVRKIAYGMIGERAVAKGLKADPTKKTYYFAEDAGSGSSANAAPRISTEDAITMDKLGIPPDKREEFLKQARPA